MTALELFEALDPLVAPAIEATFDRRDLCILAARVVLDVAAYFDIKARPVPVRVIVYNRAFASRIVNIGPDDEVDAKRWEREDGAYSVGVGFGGDPAFGVIGSGSRSAARKANKWAGHLIVEADGAFGDFAINQAERPLYGIVTGPAVVGPLPADTKVWQGTRGGTTIEYQRIDDDDYRTAPDWRDRRRREPIVGSLIRAVRK